MNLLSLILSYFQPRQKIIIGEKPDYAVKGSNRIENFYNHPPEPDDWVHTIQEDRLLPKGYGYPCLNDPKTLSLVIEAVGKIKTDKIISVSIPDIDKWCECEKCRAEKPSETMIRFVNQVAERYPTRKFSTLAYFRTEPPPTVKPRDNVQVMVTTIKLPKNEPIQTSSREDVVEWRTNLLKWLKLTKNIVIWDYYGNLRHLLMPFPTLRQMCENLRWYQKLGIRDFIIQTDAGRGHEFSELRSMLIVEMLSAPNQNIDKLIANKLIDIYGAGAQMIGRYINEISTPVEKMINWFDAIEYFGTIFTPERLEKYKCLIKSAQLVGENIDEVLLQILYTKIELGLADQSEYKEFVAISKKIGEYTINEKGVKWTDYQPILKYL